jgi:hypothetical protein
MIRTGLIEPMEEEGDIRDVEEAALKEAPEEEAFKEDTTKGETTQDRRSAMYVRE